jgi:hypothetical protein
MFEGSLTYHPENGSFTFSSPETGSSTQDCTGAYQIPLAAPGRIIINAGEGITFMSNAQHLLGPLPFETSGSINLVSTQISSDGNQATIDVTQLPSVRGLLGFLLFVRIPGSNNAVGIQAPPFFVTGVHSSEEQVLTLQYVRENGDFILSELGSSHHLPLTVKVARGMVIARLSNGSNTSNCTLRKIRIFLESDPEVVFADLPAIFTMPGPTVERISDTEILVFKDFTPGTGFGVSFGVKVPLDGGGTSIVYSPDPVIIDKQIGGSGG